MESEHYNFQKKVIYEIGSTEVIAINFTTGAYYTFPLIAKQIWQMLEKNASVTLMAELLAEHYKKDYTVILNDLHNFLKVLQKEELIEKGTALEEPQRNSLYDLLNTSLHYGWNYFPPEMHIYSDVQDLLLIDPIHDVDQEAGWPYQNCEIPQSK